MVAITTAWLQIFVAGVLLADPAAEQLVTSDGSARQTTDDPTTPLERLDGHFLPPVFAVLKAARLRDLLELNEDQQTKVDTLIKQQAAVYLKRDEMQKSKAQEDRSRRRRRSFTLTGQERSQFALRDRGLEDKVNQLLDESQQQQLARLSMLWQYGPMHPGFLYEQELELKLTKEQIERLNTLTSDWVILAAPKVQNVDALKPDRAGAVMEPVLSDAYEFQKTRDDQLAEILTKEQVLRLRQLDLRNWIELGPHPLYSPHTQESNRAAFQRGGPVPYIAGYYRIDSDDLKLREDQVSQLRQIQAEIDSDFRNRQYTQWEERRKNLCAEIESILTVDQIPRFRNLVGSDHVPDNSH